MRVVLLRLSAMGDVVQSLGAVAALIERRPDLEIGFVTQSEHARLLDGMALRLGVVEHRRGAGIGGYLRTARAIRRLRPDAVVDLQGNWKAAGLAWRSGAGRRIGVDGAGRREPSSARLLNERVAPRGRERMHPADAAELALRAIEPGLAAGPPRLHATPAEIDAEAAALEALGIAPARPFRVLVVAAPSDPKAWPVAAMQREAARSGVPCLWLTGPAEAEFALPAGAVALRHGRGSLRRLVALGALCARSGGEALGPDTGPVHVLSAAGVRTRAMFGPQDPALTAPPEASVFVREDGPDCVPCRSRRCAHAAGPVCMDFDGGSATRVSGS